jgi:hypothetical protein
MEVQEHKGRRVQHKELKGLLVLPVQLDHKVLKV